MTFKLTSQPKEKSVPADFPKGLLRRAIPAVATHAYSKRDVLELTLTVNQRLHILEAKGDWWFIARTMKGDEGWVLLLSTLPGTYDPVMLMLAKGSKLLHPPS